jgi:hypothetical protein
MATAASRLLRLQAHMTSPAAALAATAGAGTPIAVADHASRPSEGVHGGHVHPDIVRTADGTLIVVYGANEDDSPGKDVLMCTRSSDDGASWSAAVPIPCSRHRPPSVKDTGIFEIYPGTLTLLPGDRLLLTWDYYQSNGLQGRALLYATSDDQGVSWGAQQTIFDPNHPPDPAIDENRQLGTLRHSILPVDRGRWLLPLTVKPTLDVHAGPGSKGGKYPGVQLYDPGET